MDANATYRPLNAIYAVRLRGVIDAELLSQENLAVAVNVIRDELIFKNALELGD